MALINQNSIIGVTSITSPSSSNVLTVHANDTTERLRISETGLSFSGTNSSLDTSGNATFNGNVSIGGILTYEDVTNIDSVGIVTARAGIHVTGGSVGIGTDNPDQTLHLYDSTAFASFTNNADTGESGILFRRHDNNQNRGKVTYSFTDDALLFRASNDGSGENLRITSGGALLVAKTTTSLTTQGSRVDNGLITVSGDSSSTNLAVNGGGNLSLANIDSTDNNFSNIGGYNSNGLVVSQIDFINTSHSSRTGDIAFLTHNGSAMSERLRIDSNGRLSLNDNSRPASDANEGAQLRVTGTPLTRNQYYSPAGDYYGSFGYTDNTHTKSWIALDSSYNQASAVSSGIFLSAFHSDANGSACGHTIKNVRTDAGGLIFSSVHAASSTGNPAVETEKLRINSEAELVQTSNTSSTNSWYSLNSNNTVKVTNGDNDIYIQRVGGSAGYDQLVYKKTPMTDNCDISFRLSGSQPGGQWRHIGITICGDGGSDFANMDRLVIRQQGATGGGDNRIRVDRANNGGTTADVTSGSIPSFFDGTERNVLIQIRGNIIHVLSDNVLVYSEQMNAALHNVSGFFGIGIYETTGNIRLRNFQLTNYGALGVPQKRPCLQTNMSSTYGSSGSLTTNTANTGILQASAYIDLCGNYTTSGSNAYTFECPVDGIYAVNAHISMGGGSYSRHIWVMSYTMGGGNLPLGTYTEVLDLVPDVHSNHSYYNLWKFTKGTRIGMGINGNSGSLSGRNFQWGIMLVS